MKKHHFHLKDKKVVKDRERSIAGLHLQAQVAPQNKTNLLQKAKKYSKHQRRMNKYMFDQEQLIK